MASLKRFNSLLFSVMANSFFPPNVQGNGPWGEALQPGSHEEHKERSSSPRRDRDKSDDTRRSNREDRNRDKSRRRRSRSRDREDSRERRGRDRSNDRRESSRRSREHDDRDDRRRDRERDRDRDRDRDRGRSRSPYDRRSGRNDYDDSKTRKSGDGDSKFSLESAHYKNQTPNETIMIRGLAQHIMENDVSLSTSYPLKKFNK